MAKNNRNRAWFIPTRDSYLPASPIGMLLYLVYVLYLAALIYGWYVDGHRIWYLLVNVIPLSVAAAVLLQYIASKRSR